MKKFLTMLLCLALMLTAVAFAEESTTSNLNIQISEIELNFGEPITLNQTVSYSFGMQDGVLWFEIGVLENEAAVLVGQVEIHDEARYISVDGAEDALELNYGVLNESLNKSLDEIKAGVEQMNDPDSIAEEIKAMASEYEGVSVEELGDLDYKISYTSPESGMGGSFRMVLSLGGEKDFDLTSKNVVEISEDMEEYPDNDVMTVAVSKIAALETDENIAALVVSAANVFGETIKTIAE